MLMDMKSTGACDNSVQMIGALTRDMFIVAISVSLAIIFVIVIVVLVLLVPALRKRFAPLKEYDAKRRSQAISQ